ncbi:major facilitator superfamily MFS_1 (plasmid) [Gemmatirosa kalamazoonensis]|uniref:Major facilitator superfamily MFS_1 n=1 Tax=Gemmatirosa kalamazoonensis TaxID=861299 RepID=W0RNU2_9BACT|nr:MFS transporter [Gemmatirosa kalamazoonensis]AHG92406.1 major facilitator superfamily MFS_1 [Gemmatirosa kalamazoonensis]
MEPRPPDRSIEHRRWRIALLVTVAIAISYLDRQTLPWAIAAVQRDIAISNETKASLDSAFLITYGLMYLGGGRFVDAQGTRRGFLVIMLFWSLACASHGLAGNHGMPALLGLPFGVLMLGASRLLLGVGEGGGFPTATRAVAEWFPVTERSTAMGMINAGTAVGAVAAPPLIALVLTRVDWLGLAPWRWVFFLTGALGLLWTLWWWRVYRTPAEPATAPAEVERSPLGALLRHRETWAVVLAKFLSDGAWYFYLFWLPKYLFDAFHLDIRTAGAIGWIPYAASGVGSVCGGALSSRLLARGLSVNAARKIALGASAALMPWVMLVPGLHSVGWVIFVFSLAFFGQQSWSTLVMILPTDMISRRAVGTLAGLVGFGGAMGGVLLGQVVGYLRDHGQSYTPALVISGSLHVIAFAVLCVGIPVIRPLSTALAERQPVTQPA